MTIYDCLLQVKQPLMLLEQNLRVLEENMKHVSGTELEELMKQYSSMTEQFERQGGYQYRSEVIGVLRS